MIKTEKYLEVTGLLFVFLQPHLCSKAYSRWICYFCTIYTSSSVCKSSLRLLLGRFCIPIDSSSTLPCPGWGISFISRSGAIALEALVPSLAGFMQRMPVLHCTLLSLVPLFSYSSGPAGQDVAAGCGKAPYSDGGFGSPLFWTVPRHWGGDRSATDLRWFSGTRKAFDRRVEK